MIEPDDVVIQDQKEQEKVLDQLAEILEKKEKSKLSSKSDGFGDLFDTRLILKFSKLFKESNTEDNSLSVEHFKSIMMQYLPKNKVDLMHQQIDVNDDGSIQLSEFIDFLLSSEHSSKLLGNSTSLRLVYSGSQIDDPNFNHVDSIDFIVYSSIPSPTIITGGRDGKILLWNANDLSEIGSIDHKEKAKVIKDSLFHQEEERIAKFSKSSRKRKENLAVTSLSVMKRSGHLVVGTSDNCLSLYELSYQDICGRILTLSEFPTTCTSFYVESRIEGQEIFVPYIAFGDCKGRVYLLRLSTDFGSSADGGSKKRNQILFKEAVANPASFQSNLVHDNWVTALMYVSDISTLVSASSDGSIHFLHISKGLSVLRTFKGHENLSSGVRAMDWSSRGRYMISSGDRKVVVWDPYNLDVLSTLEGFSTPVVSILVTDSMDKVFICTQGKTISVYHNITFEFLQIIHDYCYYRPRDMFTSALYVDMSRSLYVGGNYLSRFSLERAIASESSDDLDEDICTVLYNSIFRFVLIISVFGKVCVYQAQNGNMIRQFNVSLDREAFFEDEHAKHKNSLTPIIKSAHFDKHQRRLITLKHNNLIQFWNFNNGQEVIHIEPQLLSSREHHLWNRETLNSSMDLNYFSYEIMAVGKKKKVEKRYLIQSSRNGILYCFLEIDSQIENDPVFRLVPQDILNRQLGRESANHARHHHTAKKSVSISITPPLPMSKEDSRDRNGPVEPSSSLTTAEISNRKIRFSESNINSSILPTSHSHVSPPSGILSDHHNDSHGSNNVNQTNPSSSSIASALSTVIQPSNTNENSKASPSGDEKSIIKSKNQTKKSSKLTTNDHNSNWKSLTVDNEITCLVLWMEAISDKILAVGYDDGRMYFWDIERASLHMAAPLRKDLTGKILNGMRKRGEKVVIPGGINSANYQDHNRRRLSHMIPNHDDIMARINQPSIHNLEPVKNQRSAGSLGSNPSVSLATLQSNASNANSSLDHAANSNSASSLGGLLASHSAYNRRKSRRTILLNGDAMIFGERQNSTIAVSSHPRLDDHDSDLYDRDGSSSIPGRESMDVIDDRSQMHSIEPDGDQSDEERDHFNVSVECKPPTTPFSRAPLTTASIRHTLLGPDEENPLVMFRNKQKRNPLQSKTTLPIQTSTVDSNVASKDMAIRDASSVAMSLSEIPESSIDSIEPRITAPSLVVDEKDSVVDGTSAGNENSEDQRIVVLSAVFLTDSKILLGACSDQMFRFWNSETGDIICSCKYIRESHTNEGNPTTEHKNGAHSNNHNANAHHNHPPHDKKAAAGQYVDPDESEIIRILTLSDTEDLLIGGYQNGLIRVWNIHFHSLNNLKNSEMSKNFNAGGIPGLTISPLLLLFEWKAHDSYLTYVRFIWFEKENEDEFNPQPLLNVNGSENTNSNENGQDSSKFPKVSLGITGKDIVDGFVVTSGLDQNVYLWTIYGKYVGRFGAYGWDISIEATWHPPPIIHSGDGMPHSTDSQSALFSRPEVATIPQRPQKPKSSKSTESASFSRINQFVNRNIQEMHAYVENLDSIVMTRSPIYEPFDQQIQGVMKSHPMNDTGRFYQTVKSTITNLSQTNKSES